MDYFAALRIPPTNHTNLIKEAYYKALQKLLTDTDSNHFTTLRSCYTQALRNARHIFEESPSSKHTKAMNKAVQEPAHATIHTKSKHNHNQAPSLELTITHLRQALNLQPNNPLILTEIAKYYLEINKYRLAIDILKSIRILSPLHTEAQDLLKQSEDAWCFRLTKRFHNLSSEDIGYLIRHKMHNNQYREALNFLEKAISTRLTDLHAPTLFKLYAECMAALRIDTASHYFEKALEQTHELNENPRAALLAYIEYLFVFKQFDTLLLLIDDLIKLDPNQHRYHYLKGESLIQTKHYKQSITSFRYAIGLSPYNAEYYALIALAYREAGHFEKSKSYAKAGDNINTKATNE
jgi:tetratricopeptide (TPR) repeat protein